MTISDLPAWDLAPLYRTPQDPALETDLARAESLTESFVQRWRGQIAAASAADLRQALAAYEELQRWGLKPYLYAELLFYADSKPIEHQALLSKIRERFCLLSEKLLFLSSKSYSLQMPISLV